MFCKFCGKRIDPSQSVCPYCSTPQEPRSGGNGFWDILDSPARPDVPPVAPPPPAPTDNRLRNAINRMQRTNLILWVVVLLCTLGAVAGTALAILHSQDKNKNDIIGEIVQKSSANQSVAAPTIGSMSEETFRKVLNEYFGTPINAENQNKNELFGFLSSDKTKVILCAFHSLRDIPLGYINANGTWETWPGSTEQKNRPVEDGIYFSMWSIDADRVHALNMDEVYFIVDKESNPVYVLELLSQQGINPTNGEEMKSTEAPTVPTGAPTVPTGAPTEPTGASVFPEAEPPKEPPAQAGADSETLETQTEVNEQ